jgi:hypothetical protein
MSKYLEKKRRKGCKRRLYKKKKQKNAKVSTIDSFGVSHIVVRKIMQSMNQFLQSTRKWNTPYNIYVFVLISHLTIYPEILCRVFD